MSQPEYNCQDLAEKIQKARALYNVYQSAIPENRDGDVTTINQLNENGELEKSIAELEELMGAGILMEKNDFPISKIMHNFTYELSI